MIPWLEEEEAALDRKLFLVHKASLILLYAEALTSLLFPFVLAAGIILGLALLNVFDYLPPVLHLLVLLTIPSGGAFWVWRNRKQWRLPTAKDAWRRVEKISGLIHRPLTHLQDRQATNLIDPLAQSLWKQHRRQLASEIRQLRLGWPDFGIARRDPYGIRTIALMIFLIGVSATGSDWSKRLWHGLIPGFGVSLEAIQAEIWISPPEYTHLSPLHLDTKITTEQKLRIPENSKILVQLSGTRSKGKLRINGMKQDLNSQGEENQRLETLLTQGNELALQVGARTLAKWNLEIVKDLAPTIDFAGKPAATDRGVLRLPYAAKDDYGITDARMRLTLKEGESLELPLVVPRPDKKEVKGVVYQDLTAHPWAGLEVRAQLFTKDAAGQEGKSPELTLALPERHFYNATAKAIVAARKALAQNFRKNEDVAEALRGLNARPDLFEENLSVFLGLNMAWRRLLARDYDQEALPAILKLLWDIALAVEDGGGNDLLANLRQLQKQLQEALAQNAPQEEIDRLMREVQQAMNDYLRNLQQQAEQAQRQGRAPRLTQPGMSVTQKDLNRMLEEARRMAQSGSKNSAQQMLDQLQQMLENLQAGITAPPQRGQGQGQGQQLMKDLAEAMRRQQQLLDQTFQQQQQADGSNGEDPGSGRGGPGGNNADMARQQEELRQTLGGLMRRMGDALGDLPQGIGDAEQQMRQATESLRQENLPDATDAQNKALGNLQQSLQSLNQQLQRQARNNSRGERPPMDPLGRVLPDANGGDSTDTSNFSIEESPLEQARRIFEELLDRRNDSSRPREEREYLERLLKQF